MSANKNHNPDRMHKGTRKLVWFKSPVDTGKHHLSVNPHKPPGFHVEYELPSSFFMVTTSIPPISKVPGGDIYEHKPLWFFGWDGVGGMACQAIKMACKPIGRAWAGDHTQIHAPTLNKPFRAGASHSAKPKMSLSTGSTTVSAALKLSGSLKFSQRSEDERPNGLSSFFCPGPISGSRINCRWVIMSICGFKNSMSNPALAGNRRTAPSPRSQANSSVYLWTSPLPPEECIRIEEFEVGLGLGVTNLDEMPLGSMSHTPNPSPSVRILTQPLVGTIFFSVACAWRLRSTAAGLGAYLREKRGVWPVLGPVITYPWRLFMYVTKGVSAKHQLNAIFSFNFNSRGTLLITWCTVYPCGLRLTWTGTVQSPPEPAKYLPGTLSLSYHASLNKLLCGWIGCNWCFQKANAKRCANTFLGTLSECSSEYYSLGYSIGVPFEALPLWVLHLSSLRGTTFWGTSSEFPLGHYFWGYFI
ncbi:hypothetical protein B0H11DRAFT_2382417 [Mycena galericulata]|nr:hypothetical protein B0H11DRAFT_2382417 [Mycena galericulata]